LKPFQRGEERKEGGEEEWIGRKGEREGEKGSVLLVFIHWSDVFNRAHRISHNAL